MIKHNHMEQRVELSVWKQIQILPMFLQACFEIQVEPLLVDIQEQALGRFCVCNVDWSQGQVTNNFNCIIGLGNLFFPVQEAHMVVHNPDWDKKGSVALQCVILIQIPLHAVRRGFWKWHYYYLPFWEISLLFYEL